MLKDAPRSNKCKNKHKQLRNVTFEGIGETITTEKDGSPTLVIQSIAGGGGWVGNVGGDNKLGAIFEGEANLET